MKIPSTKEYKLCYLCPEYYHFYKFKVFSILDHLRISLFAYPYNISIQLNVY